MMVLKSSIYIAGPLSATIFTDNKLLSITDKNAIVGYLEFPISNHVVCDDEAVAALIIRLVYKGK